MKKCPRCGKDIHDEATKCPYCGFTVSGYQPLNNKLNSKKKNMNRRPQRSPFMRTLIVMICFFMPSLLYYYFVVGNQTTPIADTTTYDLGKLGDYDKSIENDQAIYSFDSIDNFNKSYSNVSKLSKEFSSYYDTVSTVFKDSEVEENDTIYVYESNNVEAKLSYDTTVDSVHYVIDIDVDRIGSIKDITINEYVHNLEKFDDISSIDTSTLDQTVETLSASKTADVSKMDTLEKQFTTQFENHDLGNYGIAVSDDDYTYRILSDKNESFMVLISYDGTLK